MRRRQREGFIRSIFLIQSQKSFITKLIEAIHDDTPKGERGGRWTKPSSRPQRYCRPFLSLAPITIHQRGASYGGGADGPLRAPKGQLSQACVYRHQPKGQTASRFANPKVGVIIGKALQEINKQVWNVETIDNPRFYSRHFTRSAAPARRGSVARALVITPNAGLPLP